MSHNAGDRPAAPLLARAGSLNAVERGDQLAVIDGAIRWTWRELDARADAIAAGLAAAGLHLGDRVGLLAPTSASAVAFIHAAARLGPVIVPLNHRLAVPELRGYLAGVDVAAVVVSEAMAARAAQLGGNVLAFDALVGAGAASLQPAADAAAAFAGDRAAPRKSTPTNDAAAPAVIVGTSGTTGAPKGAVLTHGQLSASAAAWNQFLPPASVWLASLSLAHVSGLGIVWRAALAGVPVAVPAGGDPLALLAALAETEVSHFSTVAVQLARILDSTAGPPPISVRAVLLGGGPVPPELVRRALDRGWPVVPTYGMTESASGVTAMPTAEAGSRPGSAGRPLPGVELRIGEPAADGIGEIEVRGPSVFAGYFGRAAETAAVVDRDGWYRTGDLGSVDAAGYLTVADRRLDLIVSGGENVSPAEVEAVLASHPAVADAGVAGRPDPRWGAVPVAAIVLRDGAAATEEAILDYCTGRLARFKVPVTLVRVGAVPRFESGKLDRHALRQVLSVGSASRRQDVEPHAMPGMPTAAEHRPTPPLHHLVRPGDVRVAYRTVGGHAAAATLEERPVVLMLHATLSSGWQLKQLARLVAEWATVILPDRRGSGASRLAHPRPVALEEQVGDAVALLDELGAASAAVFGHSYGAVVALALAAAHPQRVGALVAYEPPFVGAAGPVENHARRTLAELGKSVAAAHAGGGASAAAEVFLRAIGAETALANASAPTKAALLAEGDGVLADIGGIGAATVDLSRIVCSAALVTGDASALFYVPVADAAARAIRRGFRVRLPGLTHEAPIIRPAPLADLLHDAIVTAGSRGADVPATGPKTGTAQASAPHRKGERP